jgi:hypothetical protein
MPALLRIMVLAVVLSGIAIVGYWQYSANQQARTIAELKELTAQLEAQAAARQAMIQRLSRSRRLAHLHIGEQRMNADGAIASTAVEFIELDDAGTELARQSFTVPGDVLFVDAWTVKFDPERVAEGDPLMGKTLVLLRRIYSDRLPPKDGFLIDTPGAIPPGYAAGDIGQFEKRLWEGFWSIATDAAVAGEMGVRVAQGEAVYKPVRSGQIYELVADAAGGISLTPMAGGPSQAVNAG